MSILNKTRLRLKDIEHTRAVYFSMQSDVLARGNKPDKKHVVKIQQCDNIIQLINKAYPVECLLLSKSPDIAEVVHYLNVYEDMSQWNNEQVMTYSALCTIFERCERRVNNPGMYVQQCGRIK